LRISQTLRTVSDVLTRGNLLKEVLWLGRDSSQFTPCIRWGVTAYSKRKIWGPVNMDL
jgi:hypothetical protein